MVDDEEGEGEDEGEGEGEGEGEDEGGELGGGCGIVKLSESSSGAELPLSLNSTFHTQI